MTHPELAAEIVASLSALDARSTAWLRARGVPMMALHQYPGPMGVSRIIPTGRWYELAEGDGIPAYIMPVFVSGAFSDLLDLIAWTPADPVRWWFRTGDAYALGMEWIDRAEIHDKPLRLFECPLDWLAAGGSGACVLDWKFAALHLRRVPALQCDSLAFAERVQRTLSFPSPHIPRILVRQEAV